MRAAYEDAKAHSELALELRVRLREANIFVVRAAKEAVGHTNYLNTAYAAIGSYFLTRDREGGPDIAGRPFL